MDKRQASRTVCAAVAAWMSACDDDDKAALMPGEWEFASERDLNRIRDAWAALVRQLFDRSD